VKRLISCLLVFLWWMPAACAVEEKKSAAQESLERRQRSEIMGYFMKDPGQAKLPGTAMAVGLYNQAVGHFQKSEYDLARKALDDSLQYDAMNPLAYELIGDIDNLEQKLKDARLNYETAYRIGPSDRIKEKLEKLGKEEAVEGQLARYDEEHFVIQYQKTGQPYEGFELRELLRETYRNVSSDLGYYFQQKITVLLYDDEDFTALTGMPPWVAGLYDGKVRIPINREGFDNRDIRTIAAHELTHVFAGMLSGRLAPPWINEGLAVYEENKVKPRDLVIFRAAVKTGTLFPLIELVDQKKTAAVTDPLLEGLFYEQSFQLTDYLIGRYGMFKIKQLLTEYGKGLDSQEVLENGLGISIDRLEREWRESLSV
jgi:tetratricopeptide (TPR) repeat protein